MSSCAVFWNSVRARIDMYIVRVGPQLARIHASLDERCGLLERRFRCRMSKRVKGDEFGCNVRRRKQLAVLNIGEDHAKPHRELRALNGNTSAALESSPPGAEHAEQRIASSMH